MAITQINPSDDNQAVSKQVGIPIRITIKRPVWVAKQSIPAGTKLKPSMLTLVNKPVQRNIKNYLEKTTKPTQYTARVNINEGDILDKNKLAIPPDVKRNTPVHILVSNGNGVNVSVMGTALSDGHVGDSIRVKYKLQKQQYLTAKVISKNKVLIQILKPQLHSSTSGTKTTTKRDTLL